MVGSVNVSCLACAMARSTRRPEWDQSADGARLPQAGGCRESARILFRLNRALGRRSTRFRTPDVADGTRSKPSLLARTRKEKWK